MNLTITLLLGLIAAITMFLGDMCLYFDKDDYIDKDGVNGIINIMKKVPATRLYLGGILGPISAFIYCIGFYHILFITKENYGLIAWILYFINCIGIIYGGAYHSHCAYLGLLFRHGNNASCDEFMNYLKVQAKMLYAFMIPASLGQTLMILFGITKFPFWIVIFSPFILMMLTPLIGKLPKGFHMIIRGGWTNFVYIIYYACCLLYIIAL